MFFSAAKKVAEVSGFIEASVMEEEVPMSAVEDETEVAKTIKVSSTKIKQVGEVAPYVVDPQIEYNKLSELFGVFTAGVKMYEMSCPGCGHDVSTEATSVDMQADCYCPECEYEDTFDMFYQGIKQDHSTSRTPTDDEVFLVTGRDASDYYNASSKADQYRKQLLTYYMLLNGVGDLVNRKGGEINQGMVDGKYRKWCGEGCKTSCSRGCNNERMQWFGKVLSLQEATINQAVALLEED